MMELFHDNIGMHGWCFYLEDLHDTPLAFSKRFEVDIYSRSSMQYIMTSSTIELALKGDE